MGMKICYIHKIKLYSTTKKQCIHEAFRKMVRNGKQALFEEKKSGLRKYIFSSHVDLSLQLLNMHTCVGVNICRDKGTRNRLI